MKKLLISAVLSSAILISGSLSAKTLKFQISSKAGDWAHTYLNTKNKVLEELTNGELKIDPLPTKSVVPHRETIDAVANGILDGDIVVCEKTQVVNSGDVVLVQIDRCFTVLKQYNLHAEGMVTLVSPCTDDAPQDYAVDRIAIKGVFVSLIRSAH